MVEEKYSGTKGLTLSVALNRVYELANKELLGTKDKEFLEEAKAFIDSEIKSINKDSKSFNIVRAKLTPKQWEMIYDGGEE